MKIKTSVLKTSSILIIAGVIFTTACKKDNNANSTSGTNDGNAQNLSFNGATTDDAFGDAFNVALQTSNDQSLNSVTAEQGRVGTYSLRTVAGINGYYCATDSVTRTGGGFPVTVKVDFGAGCTSADSITRSGSITYVFSGRLSTPGTTITATFNNYRVNGYQLGGQYSITNTSSGLLLSLTSAVSNGTITFPNDSSYSFSCTKTTSLSLASLDTTNLLNNKFTITGSYTVSNADGESLAANVTTPLTKELSCKNIVSGIISFVFTKGSTIVAGTLDYGDGTCDNSAVITIGSTSKTIMLPL